MDAIDWGEWNSLEANIQHRRREIEWNAQHVWGVPHSSRQAKEKALNEDRINNEAINQAMARQNEVKRGIKRKNLILSRRIDLHTNGGESVGLSPSYTP